MGLGTLGPSRCLGWDQPAYHWSVSLIQKEPVSEEVPTAGEGVFATDISPCQ